MKALQPVLPIVVAAAGWAAFPFFAPAAVALTFVGFFLAMGGILKLNVPVRRLVYLGAVAAHAGAVYATSRSPWLGAAALLAPLSLVPTEQFARRLGYNGALLTPLGPVLGIACLAAGWPEGRWTWEVVPVLLTCVFFAFIWVGGAVKLRRAVPASWNVRIGAPAPSVRLPARDGQSEFDLGTERGRFVLLCFLRGDWCPVCHVQMRIYRKEAPLLAEHKVKLVAISPSQGPEAEELARQVGVDYLLLVDRDCKAAQQFGAIEPKAHAGQDVPLPASFLVDPDGVVRWASRPQDVTAGQDPMASVRALRQGLGSPDAQA
jgi:peroxiredoxin